MNDTTSLDSAIVAAFENHDDAEAAVRALAQNGFDMTQLSIVGRGLHPEEQVVGFYNAGDRIRVWGKNGAFWGGLWGLFFGGLFVSVPIIGPVTVLGHLAAMVAGAIEVAAVAGGLSALGAALYSIGIPKDSIIQYEEMVRNDEFLVVAHGSAAQIAHARNLLEAKGPRRLDVHEKLQPRPLGHP